MTSTSEWRRACDESLARSQRRRTHESTTKAWAALALIVLIAFALAGGLRVAGVL